jgi:hypothetical protein
MLESRCLMSVGNPPIYDNGAPTDPNVPQSYQIGGRWSATASGSTGSTGTGITLTYSIAPDGTLLGSGNGEANDGSTLRSKLDTIYGSQASWLPVIQSVFNSWSAVSGITYKYETNDDGADFSSSNKGVLGTRGDVRIGAHPVDGTYNVLAHNWFPSYGDMIIDADDLAAGGYMTSTATNSLRLRNVMAHEHGHGLGLNHVDPLDHTKLMEAYASTTFDGPQFDDILAIQRNYGDFYEKAGGNNTVATATNRGTITTGTTDFINNLSLATSSDNDLYKFTLSSTTSPSFTLTPAGNPYLQGPQGGATSTFDPRTQMDLQFQLIASNGTTVLNTVNSGGLGTAETLSLSNLAAGTYYLKVLPVAGATDSAQMYTLSLNAAAPVTSSTTIALDASSNLTVTDSTGKNDAITLSIDSANSRYVLTDPNNILGTTIASATGNGTHTVNVPFSAVTGGRINFSLLAGTDTIQVNGTSIPVSIDGGVGTDTINITESSASAPVTVINSAGNDNVTVNGDNTGASSIAFTSTQHLGALSIGAGGAVTLAANGKNYLQVDTLAINANARLDLNDNDLIVNSGNFAALQSMVLSGYSGSLDASKRGIVSTSAQNTGGATILALVANSLAGYTEYPPGSGNSIATGAILGKYTYLGDTNMDGSVTPQDYTAVDSNLGATGINPGIAWFYGDTDFNGSVTAQDYTAVDSNLGLGATNPLASASVFSDTPLQLKHDDVLS